MRRETSRRSKCSRSIARQRFRRECRGPEGVGEAIDASPVEAGDEVQDRAARLVGDDLPGRERAAVADALDLVENRLALVAGLHEVRVQRLRA
jgi:hypothetical protein